MEHSRLNFLVLNAGSSSLKYAVFDATAERELQSGSIEVKNAAGYDQAVAQVLKKIPAASLHAVGHRIVHGGEKFRTSVRITSAIKKTLKALDELAPLHNPPAIKTIAAVEKAFPRLPQVAVFDTAFYVDLPESRVVYPVPYLWYRSWRIRRYGFHGISHAYVTARAAELMQRPLAQLNLISCHLGNGCSVTATQAGHAISTTMGFTPLEGLMMGTRSGSIDPGILLYLEQTRKLKAAELDQKLNHASGLLGVSGISGDFRQVESAAYKGHRRAILALTMYAERIREAMGAMAVTLGQVDALIFTGGVGEHAAALRQDVCRGLEILGITLDKDRNTTNVADSCVSPPELRRQVWIVHTREELLIAQETRRVLS